MVPCQPALADPEAYTFISGNPPIGDGNFYPRQVRPIYTAADGFRIADKFFSRGSVDISNVTGNPIFFDANNLLTRPATLISNEAAWTDPKTGFFGENLNFRRNFFELDLDDNAIIGSDIGFDLAMASVSEDLPTLNFYDEFLEEDVEAGYLQFNIGTTTNTGFARLVFYAPEGETDLDTDPNFVHIFAEEAGTFFTLNSPRTAYEARFRLGYNEMRQYVADDEGIELGQVGNVDFLTFVLSDIATPGGTTQFAVDNIVVGDATIPNDPLEEPLNFEPLERVGKNRPQYFKFDDDDPEPGDDPLFPDAPDFDITEVIDVIEDTLIELTIGVDSEPAPGDAGISEVSIGLPPSSPVVNSPVPAGLVVETADLDANDPSYIRFLRAPDEQGGNEIIRITSDKPFDPAEVPVDQFYIEIKLEGDGSLTEVRTSAVNSTNGAAARLAEIAGINILDLADNETVLLPEPTLVALYEEVALQINEGWIRDSEGQTPGYGALPPFFATNAAGSDGAFQAGRGMLQLFISQANATGVGADFILDFFSENYVDAVINQYFETLEPGGGLGLSSTAAEYATLERVRARIQMLSMPEPSPESILQQLILDDAESLVQEVIAESSVVEPLHFLNTTLDQYLRFMAAEGLDPVTGDGGSYLVPIYEEGTGRIIEFDTVAWLIADEYGDYALLYSTVPEPSSLILIGLGGLLLRLRKRR
ncbi:MAG: PEP-CTERM sorting domain-containing protein [Planctomycetota bacterium]